MSEMINKQAAVAMAEKIVEEIEGLTVDVEEKKAWARELMNSVLTYKQLPDARRDKADEAAINIWDEEWEISMKLEDLIELLNPDWIMCDDKQPDDMERVLVTIYTHAKGLQVRSGTFYKGYFMNDNGDNWNLTDEEVKAWMPLPKPYGFNDLISM